MAKRSLVDTLIYIETPEAVEISLRPAGIFVRIKAFLIDLLIRGVLAYAMIYLVIFFLNEVSLSIGFIVIFALYWLYPVLFEFFWNGQTPGKRIFNLRVVQDNGTPVSFPQSLIRNLLRTFDMLPFAYAFGIVSMLLTANFKRVGDILSGCQVIYVDEPKIKIDKAILANVIAAKPPVPLTRDERTAVISFIERMPYLHEMRINELADELLGNTDIPVSQRVDTLKSWAKFMLDGKARFES